ncbi:unnamed protein product [Linum trigynum]|uniref:DUF5666 domain-containing protein n=1 Tax=Linum trigynum TaxID=586398 RepID=A0AAV2D3C2_9ROSI
MTGETAKQEWRKKVPVIGEIQTDNLDRGKEIQTEPAAVLEAVDGVAPAASVVDKGKAVLIEEPVGAIQNADANTPPPQGGLVDADGFTLVVNKKNKVWVGSGSTSQGPRNLSSKLAAGQANGKTVRVAVQPLPPSPPKGRGRGKKRK